MAATGESTHGKSVLKELGPLHRNLRKAIPDTYRGFGELHRAAFTAGELPVKTKELIALAIAVVEGCDGCVASHAQAAVRAGATRQEAAEAIGVTFLMKGGPATISMAHGHTTHSASSPMPMLRARASPDPQHQHHEPREDTAVCHPIRCRICSRTTWAGCGGHVAAVKARVPRGQWCDGEHTPAEIAAARAQGPGVFGRLFRR